MRAGVRPWMRGCGRAGGQTGVFVDRESLARLLSYGRRVASLSVVLQQSGGELPRGMKMSRGECFNVFLVYTRHRQRERWVSTVTLEKVVEKWRAGGRAAQSQVFSTFQPRPGSLVVGSAFTAPADADARQQSQPHCLARDFHFPDARGEKKREKERKWQ